MDEKILPKLIKDGLEPKAYENVKVEACRIIKIKWGYHKGATKEECDLLFQKIPTSVTERTVILYGKFQLCQLSAFVTMCIQSFVLPSPFSFLRVQPVILPGHG